MKTIVFDFDGTLLNSAQRHINVLKECMSKLGYSELDVSDYIMFKAYGNSTKDYLKKCSICKEDCQRISTCWIEKIESPTYLKTDYLYDDTILTLSICKEKGYTLYLLSARKSRVNLIKQVYDTGIASYFKGIFCVSPTNAIEHKAKIIKYLKADLVVGDTETDWEAANASGSACYILNRGFRNELYWEKLRVKSYSSLKFLINQL